MSGPCLCGDPYCGSCGNPAQAEIEAAEEWAMKEFYKAKLGPEEVHIAVEVGIAAVQAARGHAKREAARVRDEERLDAERVEEAVQAYCDATKALVRAIPADDSDKYIPEFDHLEIAGENLARYITAAV